MLEVASKSEGYQKNLCIFEGVCGGRGGIKKGCCFSREKVKRLRQSVLQMAATGFCVVMDENTATGTRYQMIRNKLGKSGCHNEAFFKADNTPVIKLLQCLLTSGQKKHL